MSDTCKHCTARGDIKMCRATPCHTHDSWYAQQQDKEIEKLRALLSEARDEIVEYVESEYPPDMMEYPSVRVAVEMDMDIVYRIEEVLENKHER